MILYTRIIMGLPIILHLPNTTSQEVVEKVYERFSEIERQYSPYIKSSEVSNINSGAISMKNASEEMLYVLDLAHYARTKSDGYFDVMHNGVFDPSGIVKGWSIAEAVTILKRAGILNFIVDAGGDMYCAGKTMDNAAWKIGVRAPLEPTKVVKSLLLTNMAIATSGSTERGQHIYNPKVEGALEELLSISVIGPDIIWSDVYATAAFAMGNAGIDWLEQLKDYEGFAIFPDMTGVSTSGLEKFLS